MIRKLFIAITKHKIIFSLIALGIVGGGYMGIRALTNPATPTRYVLGSVEKGTLITSLSGSGQISASNQIDVKSKASGDILNVAVSNGQEVKANSILISINARDAQKTVRDAASNLASARLALEKLKKPADDYTILQAQNGLTSAQTALEKLTLSQKIDYQKARETKQKAEDTIAKAHEDSFTTIANVFLDLPTIMTELDTILYSEEIGTSETSLGSTGHQQNVAVLMDTLGGTDKDTLLIFQTSAEQDYHTAKTKYDAAIEHYKATSRYADQTAVEALLIETLETTKAITQAAKSENNYLDIWVAARTKKNVTVFSKVKTYQSDLGSAISQTNGHITDILTIQRTLQDNRVALTAAENDLTQMDQNNPLDVLAAQATVKERELSLANLKAAPEAIDLKSEELTVQQRLNALSDAQEKLADYTVRAPFDGVVAKIDVKKGDAVSASTVIATLITKQRTAEIALNEVDAAKVKVGQKTTLSFDAIDGLSITGTVAEIDSLGTVSQGVVTYTVKIIFDTQDDRVKPGMSVSATIITDIKQDVLLIPNGAVKTQGTEQYVEILDTPPQVGPDTTQGVVSATPPRQQTIQTGLTNDTSTEVVSGLKEGDQVVVRTITATTNSTAQTAPSLFGAAGGRSGATGGGTFNAPAR